MLARLWRVTAKLISAAAVVRKVAVAPAGVVAATAEELRSPSRSRPDCTALIVVDSMPGIVEQDMGLCKVPMWPARAFR